MSARDGGYTIVEALVAFAILSASLVALYAAGGTSLRLLGASTSAEQASLLARSKLDAIAATRVPLPRTEQGRFDGTDIAWSVEARDVEPEPNVNLGPMRLQDVRLTVTWDRQTLVLDTRHLGIAPP